MGNQYNKVHSNIWIKFPVAAEDRFWSKVKKGDGCWEYQAARDKDGYGAFWYKGRNHTAHRVSWMLTNGEIPDGMFCCHRCDNPPCVRPDHLFIDTPKGNIRDAATKNRMPGNMARQKLSPSDDIEIVRLRDEGVPWKKIQAQFGIARSSAREAMKRANVRA